MNIPLQAGHVVNVWPSVRPEWRSVAMVSTVASNQLTAVLRFLDTPRYWEPSRMSFVSAEGVIMIFTRETQSEMWGEVFTGRLFIIQHL